MISKPMNVDIQRIKDQFDYINQGLKYPFRDLYSEFRVRQIREEGYYNRALSLYECDSQEFIDTVVNMHQETLDQRYYDQFRVLDNESLASKEARYLTVYNKKKAKLEANPKYTSDNQFFYRMHDKHIREREVRFPTPKGITPISNMYKKETKDTEYLYSLYREQTLLQLGEEFYNHLIANHSELMTQAFQYFRPPMNPSITLLDFLTPSEPTTLPDKAKHSEQIVDIIIEQFNLKPQPMIHYVDTIYAGLPLNTGAGYYNKHSIKIKTYAKETCPHDYKSQSTKRGYFHNAYHHFNRTHMHYLKLTGLPFLLEEYNGIPINIFTVQEQMNQNLALYTLIMDRYNRFINRHPTVLYTRSHITHIDKLFTPKLRPIYAVDDRFLTMELMVTFPIFVQSRNYDSAMLYNFETLRGGCEQLFKVAMTGKHEDEYEGTPRYTTFLGIDWSKFDQNMPKWISKLFFTMFIPKLQLVNIPYHPTFEYPTHPSIDTDKTAQTATSILSNQINWFTHMTYASNIGYSYRKIYRGIPSGMFTTQFIDSFCNLYMIVDVLLAIGHTKEDILKLFIKVLGDDNIIFSKWTTTQQAQFLEKLKEYADHKYQMTLNLEKSMATSQISELEVLSYKIGKGGQAEKDIGKQLAGLLFPERELIKEHASSRAIAFAITSLGRSEEFYIICKKYYEYFQQYRKFIETPAEEYRFMRSLPHSVTWLEEIRKEVDFGEFPSIETCRQFATYWKGPLGYDSKWRKSHFIYPPDYDFTKLNHIYGEPLTLFNYLKQRNLTIPEFPLTIDR